MVVSVPCRKMREMCVRCLNLLVSMMLNCASAPFASRTAWNLLGGRGS